LRQTLAATARACCLPKRVQQSKQARSSGIIGHPFAGSREAQNREQHDLARKYRPSSKHKPLLCFQSCFNLAKSQKNASGFSIFLLKQQYQVTAKGANVIHKLIITPPHFVETTRDTTSLVACVIFFVLFSWCVHRGAPSV